MALPAEAAEPPMEEILASIRRIITEEPAETEVPGGEASAGASAPEPPRSGANGDVADAEDDAQGADASTQAAPAETAALDAGATAAPPADTLVSDEAGGRAGAAFDRLAGARGQAARTGPSYVMPAEGRTLEDVTRELLEPLLKAWLDEHLPAIVEARVDEEVTRIARGRVR